MKSEERDNEIRFGTEGWRGIIGGDFNFANVRAVSQASADYLASTNQSGRRVIIGYDNRFLSEKYAAIIGDVFAGNKFEPMIADTSISTPNLCHSVRHNGALLGMMVTASHNPPRFNGIKVKAPYGGPVPDWVNIEIEKRIGAARGRIPIPADTVSGLKNIHELRSQYIEYLKLSADISEIRGLKKKVVIDTMCGSGSGYMEKILPEKNLVTVRNYRDALFAGVNPEPIEENLAPLKKAVSGEKACAGIALDGDADRLGVIDDRGRYLPPHIVFPLFLYYLAEYKKLKGKVVQTISMGYLSERIAKGYGLGFEEAPVGFKHVCAIMLKGNVIAGGEESGGYSVRGDLPERDGMLCGLVLLEMLASTGKSLSGLVNEMQGRFGRSHFLRKDIPLQSIIYDKKIFSKNIEKVMAPRIAGLKITELRSYDGVKIILSDDSWLLLRPSGTEPKLRIYAESASAEFTRKLLLYGRKIVAVTKH